MTADHNQEYQKIDDKLLTLRHAEYSEDLEYVTTLADSVYGSAIEIEYWEAASRSQALLAAALIHQGKYSEATTPAQVAFMLADKKNLPIELGYSYYALGSILAGIGNYPEALEVFLKLRKIAEENNDPPLIELALRNIAFLHISIEKYEKGIVLGNEALDLAHKHNLYREKALGLQNLGIAYRRQGNVERALEYYMAAIELTSELDIFSTQVIALGSIVEGYCHLGNLEKAEEALQQLEVLNHNPQSSAKAKFHLARGTFNHAKKLLTNAAEDYLRTYELAKDGLDQQFTILALDNLIQAYRDLGDFENAFICLEELHNTKTALIYDNSRIRYDVLNIFYQTNQLKHEAEIQRLRSEKAEKELVEIKRSEAARLEQEKLEIVLEQERLFSAARERVLERLHHEFRTPLSIIRASIEMLNRYQDKLSSERFQSHSQNISDQFKHIDQLLNNITSVLKTDESHSSYNLSDIPVVTICERAIENAEEQTRSSERIQFKFLDTLNEITADAILLERILTQILTNALKFSNDIVILEANATGYQLIFEITDKGIGIPAEELEKVFMPLYRGSNIDEAPGVGLGLGIIQDCVSLLNGKIHITSTVDQGTKVRVVLPMANMGAS